MRLTKKEKQYYKKLLGIKLEKLGVEDRVMYKGTGKFQVRTVPNKEYDKNKPIGKDNAPANYQKVEKMQAVNTYRNLIKTLLKQGSVEVIEKFLYADIQINPPETKTEPDKRAI